MGKIDSKTGWRKIEMKRFVASICLASFLSSVFGQVVGLTESNVASNMGMQVDAAESVRGSIQMVADPPLAMSVSDDPVTAGDVYTLSFAAGATPIVYTIPVDTTYRIRVANLGVLNCKGLTYNQPKSQVDSLVSKNYPMGGVQFILTSPAIFLVVITGEVRDATERKAWALTRLSSFISDSLTDYSS
ncbi:MAG: ligand-binding protein, partial [Treponemataceae bacterium]|nr:ligand-binding protein [Treponemataceae bacterium]